jgi:hypothetical protein
MSYLGNKVKLSLCLTKHHAMKTYVGMEVSIHAFLTLDGSEWWASRPGVFTSGERAPPTTPTYTLDRMLGGPQSRSDTVAKKKIPSPRRESTLEQRSSRP